MKLRVISNNTFQSNNEFMGHVIESYEAFFDMTYMTFTRPSYAPMTWPLCSIPMIEPDQTGLTCTSSSFLEMLVELVQQAQVQQACSH